MDSKNYTQVLIDGKIYTLGGSEDEGYLQRAASYVNEKNNTLRKIPGFSKQSVEYQTVMAELNMADDYFKALEHSRDLEHQRDELERETYSLKHELVSTQMKLEVVLRDLEERQRELEELTREKHRLERKLREAAQTRADHEAAAAAEAVNSRAENVPQTAGGREEAVPQAVDSPVENVSQTAGGREEAVPQAVSGPAETARESGFEASVEVEADSGDGEEAEDGSGARESQEELARKALHAAMAARQRKKR